MAEVFLARSYREPGGVFAVKCLHQRLAERRQFVDMFFAEGRVAMLLEHPCIVRTLEAGTAGDRYFIRMEYLSGQELRLLNRFVRDQGSRLPVPAACWITEQILDALHYAHTATDTAGNPLALVNRDVSPTNVVLTFAGQVKLIDFGIAQTTVGFTSQIGHIRGKIAYMSPEQVRGLAVDLRSDVFSAGIILHELLTGRRLFTGDSDFSLMEAIRSAPIPAPSSSNPMVDPQLDEIVLRALERPVDRRYAGASEFAQALRDYRTGCGQAYGEAELSELMRSAFAEQHEHDMNRLQWAAGLPMPPETERDSAAGQGGQAAQGAPPAAAGARAVASSPPPGAASRPHLIPILVGLLVGLLVTLLIYWLVLS